MTVETAEIERVLVSVAHSDAVVLTPTADLPANWRPIADSDDAQTRRSTAMSLWHKDFLDLVPNFADALNTELTDVRVGQVRGESVLVYAFEHFEGGDRSVVCWLGWDTATFGDHDPPFFDSVPEPVRRFYRDVHAGFVAPDWNSNGPRQPRYLQPYADYLGCPDGVPNWPEGQVDSTRLLLLATTGGDVHLCVSPDLPPGQAVTVYSGVPDPPGDFATLLDDAMTAQFDDPDWGGT